MGETRIAVRPRRPGARAAAGARRALLLAAILVALLAAALVAAARAQTGSRSLPASGAGCTSLPTHRVSFFLAESAQTGLRVSYPELLEDPMCCCRALPLPMLALILVSCTGKQIDAEAERAALMQTSRDWAAAATAGDLERIVSYWADDAILLPPDQPAIIGKEAIGEFVRESMAMPGFSITWDTEQATIAAAGDLAYMVERNRSTFADSAGTIHTQYGKGVTIWRKNPAGGWKCVIDTWNGSPTEHVLPAAL